MRTRRAIGPSAPRCSDRGRNEGDRSIEGPHGRAAVEVRSIGNERPRDDGLKGVLDGDGVETGIRDRRGGRAVCSVCVLWMYRRADNQEIELYVGSARCFMSYCMRRDGCG